MEGTRPHRLDGLDLADRLVLRLHPAVPRSVCRSGRRFARRRAAPRHTGGWIATRGDRLFITLLGSAFIFLAWLGFFGLPLWGPLIVSLIYAFVVFRWA